LGLHDSFEKQTTVNLTKIFLKIDPAPDDETLTIEMLNTQCSRMTVTGNYLIGEKNIFVKDAVSGDSIDSGLRVPASGKSADPSRNLFLATEDTSLAYYAYIFPDLEESGYTCNQGNRVDYPDDYDIGSIEVVELISDKKIQDLGSEYENNYENLKTEFNLPSSVDFAILIGDMELSKNVPEDIEVKAKVYNQDVLMGDGTIVKKEIIFKIW